MQQEKRDAEHSPPEDVVDDRVEQHTHEQRQRADDEPKRQSTPDRTVGTEASPQVDEERRAARSQDEGGAGGGDPGT